MTDISNSKDMLDVHDIITRFEELEAERENAIAPGKTAREKARLMKAWDKGPDGEEYVLLKSLLDTLRGNGWDEQWRGDWYPITLIRDLYWHEYVQEYAEDVYGKEMGESKWPFNCIDWERAAEELQRDYSSVKYDGVTYWYR